MILGSRPPPKNNLGGSPLNSLNLDRLKNPTTASTGEEDVKSITVGRIIGAHYCGESIIKMTISLPMKLALFVAVLAVSLVVMLCRVHQATQFQAIDPIGELGDLPTDIDARRILADENSERETGKVLEEVEEKRGPMNILLF